MKETTRTYFVLLCSFLWLLANTSFSQAPPWVWAKDVHSSASEWATDVAVDPVNGDVVAVGVFNSDLSAYYGSDFASAVGGGFVARYDANGNVLWAFPIGNNADDACNSVTISANRNIYVTGYFQNIADFRGTSLLSNVLSATGGKDIFIAKYNTLGQLQWVRKAGGNSDDEGYSVCTNANEVFITGYFTGSGNFSGVPTISNQPNENLFVAAYDALGNIQWLTDGGSGQSTFGRDITADNNNVYVTGDFMNSVLNIYDFTGVNVTSLVNLNGSKADAFVLSISATGPFLWIKGIHSNNDDFGRGITQNASGIYVTGSISSSATFPGYASNPVDPAAAGLDMFVAQLRQLTGATNWVRAEAGPSSEEGTSICIDTLNLVTVTGYYQSALNFNGGATLTSSGSEDIFVAAYNNSGGYQWATTAGDNGVDIPHGISAASAGEIYVAGEYENNAQFGSNTLTADSPKNAFVAKLGCVPVGNNAVSAAQTVCSGQTPSTLNGTLPTGSSAFTYLWQSSPNNTTWSAATGTNNTQNYSPPALASNTYFRRIVTRTGGCAGSDTSTSILITVNQPPTPANAGADSSLCVNSINMYATPVAVGTATWTLVSGGGVIGSANSPTSSITSMAVGVNVFAWSSSNGVCAVSRDTVKISVGAPPSTASAGSDQTICSTTYTLNGNTPASGTGLWSVLSGSATVTSPSTHNSPVTGMSNGVNTLVWSISNSCGTSSDTVRITVSAPPTLANAGSDQSICGNSYTLNANNPTVGTGNWVVLSGGGTVSNPSQFNSSVSGMTAGVNSFVWAISNGTCQPSKDTVSITVSLPPTGASAGSNQNICASTYTLNANTPSVGTGTWTVTGGGAIVTTPGSPNSVANNLSAGNNIFVWTISNGICPSSSSSVTISVTAMPSTANAGSNQTICNDSTFLNGNTATVGTGNWSVVSGGATVANPSQNNSLVYNLSVGNNVFMWSIANGICPASTSTVNVNVSANPGAAMAGSNQAICSSTVTLNATTPSPGSGTWTLLAGSGTITSPGTNVTNVNGLSVGLNSFVWTVSNGVCPSNKDTVNIKVDAMPSAANAGIDQNVCSTSASLNAVAPVVGTGMWSVVQGSATINSPSNNASSVSGLTNGTNIFQWTVSNGTCPSGKDSVVINMNSQPSQANAGGDQVICTSNATLSGNTPATGTGTWSLVSGSGAIISPVSANSGVTGLGIGQNIFVWSIVNGVCASSVDSVIITVAQAPSAANAGPDQNICVNTSSTILAGTPLTIGSGTWSVASGSGTFTNANQNNTGVSGLSAGQNIFVWTVSNSVCPSDNDTVRVNVFPMPSVANAGNDTIVTSGPVTLHANIPASGSGSWSVVAGAGTFVNSTSAASQVNDLGIGDNIFSWTISNGVCPDSHDEVMVHVNDLVIPNGFSPNFDGTNDYFEIPGLGQFRNVKLEVFNRWGNLVYQSEDYKNTWGGQNTAGDNLTEDTYYYVLVIAKKEYKGFVVLKRS